jgi:hypothetical protein
LQSFSSRQPEPTPRETPYVERPSYLSSYEKWADEKMRWWDEEHRRLQIFLSQLDESWSRQREESLHELEEEIKLLKHDTEVNKRLDVTMLPSPLTTSTSQTPRTAEVKQTPRDIEQSFVSRSGSSRII